jgi:hypothetical protein
MSKENAQARLKQLEADHYRDMTPETLVKLLRYICTLHLRGVIKPHTMKAWLYELGTKGF